MIAFSPSLNVSGSSRRHALEAAARRTHGEASARLATEAATRASSSVAPSSRACVRAAVSTAATSASSATAASRAWTNAPNRVPDGRISSTPPPTTSTATSGSVICSGNTWSPAAHSEAVVTTSEGWLAVAIDDARLASHVRYASSVSSTTAREAPLPIRFSCRTPMGAR